MAFLGFPYPWTWQLPSWIVLVIRPINPTLKPNLSSVSCKIIDKTIGHQKRKVWHEQIPNHELYNLQIVSKFFMCRYMCIHLSTLSATFAYQVNLAQFRNQSKLSFHLDSTFNLTMYLLPCWKDIYFSKSWEPKSNRLKTPTIASGWEPWTTT